MSPIGRVITLLVVMMLPGIILAQSSDAVLVGIMVIRAGSVLPGSTVAATNTATGVSREVVSNETGAYQIGPLTPGTYEVRSTRTGFKTKIQPNVILQTGATLKMDMSLDVGDVSERIEVSAVAPMLQTQETSVGGVITTRNSNASR